MFRPVRNGAVAAALSVVVAGMALAPATMASADTQLLGNGTFDGGTTSGWKATNATLSVVSPGFGGTGDSAEVTPASTATSYSMYASPKPGTNLPQGTQLEGNGEVLGVAGRSVCLVLQESTTGGTVVQSVQKCVSATGSWQALTAADLTTQTAGDSVGFMIRQTGAQTGDSVQADSLTLTEFSSPPPPPPPPPSSAAEWPLNETSGTVVHDISGNGHNGTRVGPVKIGVPGYTSGTTAYSFPGTKSPQGYLTVPYSSTLVAGTRNINISFYLNTTHHDSNLNADYDLVRMGDYPNQEYKVELAPNGQLNCTYHGSHGGGNHIQAGPDLADGAWHYIECIKTATDIELWIGTSPTTATEVGHTTFTVGSVSPPSGAPLIMGAHPGSDWYWGLLDDVTLTFS
jgi:hypothetical protein